MLAKEYAEGEIEIGSMVKYSAVLLLSTQRFDKALFGVPPPFRAVLLFDYGTRLLYVLAVLGSTIQITTAPSLTV